MSLSFATCSYKTINNAGKDFKIGSSLDKSGQNKLNKYLGSFKSLFVDELNEINVTNAGACYVKTKTSTPISCQSNKLTRKQNEMLCEKVSELLRKGVIQHSESPWCSNAYVKENPDDGKLELRVNYAKLNEAMEDMDYYPGAIEHELRYFEEASIFSKVVIKDGFYQIPMHPEHKMKTAFKTELGQFEFNVMPYNMKNSEKVFHKILVEVLGYREIHGIKYHSNEILIPGQDLDYHLEALKLLFKKLRDANFKIDVVESCFCVDKVSFGGYQFGANGYTVCPDVAEKIRTTKTPRNVTELKAFLELTKLYKHLIPNYEIHVRSIQALKANASGLLPWNEEAKAAFNQLIVDLISAPQVAYFREGANMQIRFNVQPAGTSCVLQQESYRGGWKPVAYCGLYRGKGYDNSCKSQERDALLTVMDEFASFVEEDYVEVLIGHSSFDFLHHAPHKLVANFSTAHLYCYVHQLEENSNYQLKDDPNSKHVPGKNCVDQTEEQSSEEDALNQLYFSDSD